MRPIDELTMYAYGLLEPQEEIPLHNHVEQCDACAETVRRLRSERQIIEKAATSDGPDAPPATLLRHLVERPAPLRPRARSTLSWSGVAAAAVLLVTLAWVLFRAPRPEKGSVPVAQAGGDDVDHLIAELKSPSPLRREIAALALKSYGSTVVEKLRKAKADPAVIDACRAITPEMRALENKLETIKIDLNFEATKIEDILSFLRDFSGLNLIVDAAVVDRLDLNAPLTLKVKDKTLASSLRRILDPKGLTYVITEENVVLLTDRKRVEPEGKSPIRVPRPRVFPTQEIEALASDLPEVRDRAARDLRRLGFAAEPALWNALDAPTPEVRGRAADLLRTLYVTPPPAIRTPLEDKLLSTRVTLDIQNGPLTAILEYLGEACGVPIAVDTVALPKPEEEFITFKVQDIVVEGALRLLLQPRKHRHAVAGDIVVVTSQDKILKPARPPFWTTPEEARRIETLLEDLASDDAGRHESARRRFEELGEAVLGPLEEASRVMDLPAAARCRVVRQKILEELRVWVPDEVSGFELQNLTAAQRDLLGKKFIPGKEVLLKDVFLLTPVTPDLRAGQNLGIRGSWPKEVRLDSLLKAVLRPAGLDFYLKGETVVVDTAANVRAAIKN